MTEEQLKARAYDLIIARNQIDGELYTINNQLSEMQKEKQQEDIKKTQ